MNRDRQIMEARAAYLHDGAAVLRGVLDQSWIEKMRTAVNEVLASPGEISVEYTPENKQGRYYGDFFIWRRHNAFRDLVFNSSLPRLAADIMESSRVDFFYDQLLVKEPMTAEPTPVHQDLPYWPVRGEQIVSIWVPFDPVTPETGVVQYLKGSHKWGKTFAPEAFSADSGFADVYAKMDLEPINEVRDNLDDFEKITWSLEPGDVIIHHPLTVHFAPGNQSASTRRRALALRYTGDDAVYDARPGTFITNPKIAAVLPKIMLQDGDPLECELFPCVIRPD